MNKKYKEDFIRAGQLARDVRSYGKSLIKPGSSYNAVIAEIKAFIYKLGAIPAFPPQMALNEVAAHFLVDPDQDIIFSDELVKLDIGVCFRGAIGDCAVTVDLSGKYLHLIEAVEASLLKVEQNLKVGLSLGEIGAMIENTASSYGFKSVKNLCGHGLGFYKVHVPPTIPNFNNHSNALIKPGMTFAVEPFVTDGAGLIEEVGNCTLFSFTGQGSARSELGRKLLKKIKTFQGLPFAIHDLLEKEIPYSEMKKTVDEMMHTGVITGYAPLVEKARGRVAQAENSFLVDEQGQVFITTR